MWWWRDRRGDCRRGSALRVKNAGAVLGVGGWRANNGALECAATKAEGIVVFNRSGESKGYIIV
jgi:hypothetical protein